MSSKEINLREHKIPELQQELKRRDWALSALARATASLAHTSSVDLLVNEVCKAIVTQGPYVLAWVGRAEKNENKDIHVLGGAGSAILYIENIGLSWSDHNVSGAGPCGKAIRTGQPSIVVDSETDIGYERWRKLAGEFDIRSVVACPIFDGSGEVFGALMVYSKVPNAFGSSEIELFQSLAQEISFGIRSIERQHQLDAQIQEREVMQERLAAALRATIEAMSKTMEWRDPYTAGHQKRVASIATEIAKKLDFEQDAIQALYMAAMVHDIGKVAVPSEILTKPTRLTNLESQLIQEHVEAGYQILRDIPFPWPIAEMVRQHHERLDGSGYPKALKGDEICLEAKILGVADTIESMATHRPYRAALGLQAAINEIQAQSDIKFDAKIVKVAVDLMESGWLASNI